MLIEPGWTPGVWIDGHPSHDPATTDAFGTFAHRVHDDLIASRTAGRIPAHVEITTSASTITPLWGDNPPVWLLHIRLTGLGNPEDDAARDEVTDEAFASLDRRGAEHFSPDEFGQYAGALIFVNDQDQPQGNRMHKLRHPNSPSNALPTARPSTC